MERGMGGSGYRKSELRRRCLARGILGVGGGGVWLIEEIALFSRLLVNPRPSSACTSIVGRIRNPSPGQTRAYLVTNRPVSLAAPDRVHPGEAYKTFLGAAPLRERRYTRSRGIEVPPDPTPYRTANRYKQPSLAGTVSRLEPARKILPPPRRVCGRRCSFSSR